MTVSPSLCPCGSKRDYTICCQPLHNGTTHAATPEQLMRSRYSAYTLKDAKYIFATYAKSQQSSNAIAEIKDFANSCRFVKLTVLNSEQNDELGFVEFKAHYFYQNLFCELHENSKFIKEDAKWCYLSGDITPVADIKVGRNDECPCGSGKKYKKCHSL